jgi:hypothetical protein
MRLKKTLTIGQDGMPQRELFRQQKRTVIQGRSFLAAAQLRPLASQATPEHRVHVRQEKFKVPDETPGVEGLQDEVVTAGGSPTLDVSLGSADRQERDRHFPDIGIAAQASAYLEPVHAGHVYVEHDQAGCLAPENGKTFLAVRCAQSSETGFARNHSHQRHRVEIIVDDKDVDGAAMGSESIPRTVQGLRRVTRRLKHGFPRSVPRLPQIR